MSTSSARSTVRRFEFSAGHSHKFWEISAVGAEVTVRLGRIGSVGQTQVKSLADAATAGQYVDQLIGQKLKKGYVVVQ